MARTRLNPRRAKQHQTYTVEEVARLYAVQRNTVRSWIKTGGLIPLDGGRPILVMGASLRGFLEVRRAQARRPCPPGELYCFSCRVPRAPAMGMADFVPQAKGAGKLTALCAACGTVMHRRARQEALPLILPKVPVRIVRASPRLGVAEGIETALAYRALTGVPTWAALSTSGLKTFTPPAGVKLLTIAADGDTAGVGAAKSLVERASRHCDCIISPAPDGEDWADALKGGAQ